MPTIYKQPKKPHSRSHNERNEAAYKLYNTQKWRKLRLGHLMEHPLCEMCEKEGKVTPAVDVHHIQPFQDFEDPLLQQYWAYNPENLMSLCRECHRKLHEQMKNQ